MKINNSSKKKVAFYTLGCKLNFAETSTISRSFPADQYEKVKPDAKADVYVINTCSVTEAADKKCRQTIRKFINRSPDAFIAVVGCYAQLNPDVISSIPGVDLVLGTNEKFDISGYLNTIEKREETEIHCCEIPVIDFFNPSFSIGERTRSFLKIQDGCDYRCSYCTIPLARGRSRNQDISAIVSEAGKIARTGITEVVLTGVNVGDFGKSTGESFTTLLKELEKVDGIERLRVSSLEPDLLSDELIDLIAMSSKILPHFHIPLQSGSDNILGSMKRRYRRDLFAGRVRLIRDKMPLAGIGADLIAGFPGETEIDFQDTWNFLNDMPVTYLHVFSFSERPGTVAASLPGKVPVRLIEERSKKLITLSQKKHTEFCMMNIGKTAKVLFEHTKDNGMITGFTESYLRTEIDWDNRLCGKIIDVRLTGVAPSGRMSAQLI
jgi:threonylcarbamoyladenosine tRNA methylthiotransferase MtaB